MTVPLVLALGIGISRMIGDSDGGASGFGVVTLASLFPIITVLLLGSYYVGQVPDPDSQPARFFAHEKTSYLFESESEKLAYLVANTDQETQAAYLAVLS